MFTDPYIENPIGLKLRKLINMIMKKLKLKLTFEKRMEILQMKGLKIGERVLIDPSAKFDQNFCHLISIGDNCVICEGAMIMAHDSSICHFTNNNGRAGKVEIKENCIISANSIILPGVTIGPNVLVSAGSVVNKDIPPNSCVLGVPARYYKDFSECISEHNNKIRESPFFERLDCIGDIEKLKEEKRRMIKETEKRDIYYKLDVNGAEKKNIYVKRKNSK